jgi:translocation and assembly module TamA
MRMAAPLRWLPALVLVLLPQTGLAAIEVELEGVRGRIEANVRSYLDLVRFADREDLSDAAVRRLHQRAGRQVREALRPFGYYSPELTTSLAKDNGTWRAHLEIDPGRPARWTQIDVRIQGPGTDHPDFRQIVADSRLQPGNHLRHREYDDLRRALERAASARGYLDARFVERRLEVDPATRSARAVLHFETGPRYRFGEVVVEQTVLRDSLIQRLVFARQGEPYDSAALLRTQYAMFDIGYFSTVLIERGDQDPETLTVPVTIRATKIARQRIRLGIGYATDSRLRLSLGSEWRRINDRGHTAAAEIRASRPTTEVAMRYQIPIGDMLTERFAFRAGAVDETLGDLDSRRVTLGANYLRAIGDWQRSVSGDFVHETTRNPGRDQFTEFLFVPGIGFERLEADDPVMPVKGWRLRGELRGSHSALGAQADFLRFSGLASLVRPMGAKWRLSVRGELGTSAVDGFVGLPASQRFYAGGDQSVRGYGYQDLSPTDADGNRIGGRHLLFGSIEFQRRISRLFSGAVFVDAGNAFDEWGDPMEAAAGLGIHVHTPVGRVRVEVARSLTESRSPRLHLSVRPDL